MPSKAAATAPAPTPAAAMGPVTFDQLLAKLGARDRANVERHLEAVAAQRTQAHVRLWQEVAKTLAGLASQAVNTVGQHAVQFFAADGKYRKQLFAMEDPRDGQLHVFMEDATPAAIKAKVLVGSPKKVEVDAPGGKQETLRYEIPGSKGDTLQVELLSAASTADAPAWYKHLLGWNRKAIRITLEADTATPAQVKAVRELASLAAAKHVPAAAAAS